MRKKFITLLIAATLLILFTACQSDVSESPIIGEWEITEVNDYVNDTIYVSLLDETDFYNTYATLNLNEDGTYNYTYQDSTYTGDFEVDDSNTITLYKPNSNDILEVLLYYDDLDQIELIDDQYSYTFTRMQ